MEQLQQRTKALRDKMGWSQEDLARQLDVSLSTVQRWESKGANPTRLARRELKRLFRKAGIKEKTSSSAVSPNRIITRKKKE